MIKKKRWELITRSPFAWIQIASLILSLATYLSGYPKIGFSISIVAVIAISMTCLHYVQKAHIQSSQVNSYEDCYEILHNMNHDIRDSLTIEKLREIRYDDWIHMIKKLLTMLEIYFSTITFDYSFHASIMLPDKESDIKLITAIRSLNESNTRNEKKTTLLIGQGIAGKAFHEGASKYSNDLENDNRFLRIREDCFDYYRSVVSSPFKVNNKFYGVVNVDCEHKGVFEKNSKYLVQSIADIIGCLFQLQLFIGNQQK